MKAELALSVSYQEVHRDILSKNLEDFAFFFGLAIAFTAPLRFSGIATMIKYLIIDTDRQHQGDFVVFRGY